MTYPNCKVLIEAKKTHETLEELAIRMRRLQRALNQCDRCPEKNCPLLMEVSAKINTALVELAMEWGL